MDSHGGSDQTLKQSAHFIIWMGISFFLILWSHVCDFIKFFDEKKNDAFAIASGDHLSIFA